MYYLKSEQCFDSAHFLADYEGKCKNIHGHRWRVVVEVMSLVLQDEKQLKGMVVDFAKLKQDIKKEVDYLDHALLIEKNSLKITTLQALREEGFRIIELDFRPTAELFARYFYNKMVKKGYQMKRATIYETPNNCASYEEDSCLSIR
ncbi:preQ(0) biosynthesis protein QueD [Lachnotalea glycerini]|uniref:6-carboxy-5,6,7,8-tetrahydropterin synthase n=1 Tax=Lachnotalea glycerini TaxID=1763509 RepID=A0A255IR36_9FIRM|nr:6-carboxytetrahydropterin synthase QueD [Lachnotalea glycerini]PXV87773.1 preQ(0) biosynthesis protein QueD [Lachnotalea glycerini]RDY32061.1 6-carboxytetrahydropterin synthase QueD [Lachnotalea glycerini]